MTIKLSQRRLDTPIGLITNIEAIEEAYSPQGNVKRVTFQVSLVQADCGYEFRNDNLLEKL
jgi:hypothetical protein